MEAYRHTVKYYETDRMGFTHHSNYVRWMEEARIDCMDALGWPYARFEKEGIISPVTAIECRFKQTTTFTGGGVHRGDRDRIQRNPPEASVYHEERGRKDGLRGGIGALLYQEGKDHPGGQRVSGILPGPEEPAGRVREEQIKSGVNKEKSVSGENGKAFKDPEGGRCPAFFLFRYGSRIKNPRRRHPAGTRSVS